jgi:CBS domain-containing protein
MRVHELMSQPVTICDVNDALVRPAMLMWENDCGAVAVVRDDGVLAGMITDRDICMAAYTQGRNLEDILVNVAMAYPVISATVDQDVREVEALMAVHQVHRIPVVDADGKPIGMLSLTDLARASVEQRTPIKDGLARVAHLLAAITSPRSHRRKAA